MERCPIARTLLNIQRWRRSWWEVWSAFDFRDMKVMCVERDESWRRSGTSCLLLLILIEVVHANLLSLAPCHGDEAR